MFQKIAYPQSEKFTSHISWSTMDQIIKELFHAAYKKEREVLVRMDENKVIAFLSNRYIPYDNRDLLSSIDIGLFDVAWERDIVDAYVNDYKCLFKVLFPDHVTEDPDTGYKLTPGLFVSNDETGNGAVHVHCLIYCGKYCFTRIKHISAQRMVHTAKYVDAVKAVVKSCEALPQFIREFISSIHAAQDHKLGFADVSELYEYLGKTVVRKDEVKNILSYWDSNHNLWTLACAISEAGRDCDPLRRTELEKLATQILVRKY
jgi:hypothetical protein